MATWQDRKADQATLTYLLFIAPDFDDLLNRLKQDLSGLVKKALIKTSLAALSPVLIINGSFPGYVPMSEILMSSVRKVHEALEEFGFSGRAPEAQPSVQLRGPHRDHESRHGTAWLKY